MNRLRALALLAAAALALGCASTRRPAVVATAGSGGGPAAASAPEAAAPETPRAVDSGPDVQPLREDAAAGQEILGGASSEGGPLGDVLFDYDTASLSDGAVATLGRHAQWLQQNPGTKLSIEGHCDQRGTVEYNLALGELRAQAVREHLVSLGVAAERLTTVSYGKEKPLDHAMTDAAFAKNRRAHFVVTR